MNQIRAFYSLVQYMPAGGRAEAANVGVVLFTPMKGLLEIKSSESLSRVRKFFDPSGRELDKVRRGLQSLRHRLQIELPDFFEEEKFRGFIDSRADALRLTPPRLVMVDDFAIACDALFRELVEVDAKDPSKTKKPGPAFPPSVAMVLESLGEKGLVKFPKKVIVPTVQRPFRVDAEFQNGVANFLRAESLALSKGGSLEKRLSDNAFNGQLIHQHGIDDRDSKLVVLSSDPNADPKAEERFQEVLSDFHVRFVPYCKTSDYAKEVEKTAHL